MQMTQSIRRIKKTEKEIDRFREDVEDWEKTEDALDEDCRAREDLIAKANFLFGRILALDEDYQEVVLTRDVAFDAGLDESIRSLLNQWFHLSRHLDKDARDVEGGYGVLDGVRDLRRNIRNAASILTPDDAFFRGDRLTALRDAAIDDHRAGLTEPLLGDG